MTTIVLYTRRNVGLCMLSYLVAKGFKVKVITDQYDIMDLANDLGCEITTLDTMYPFDYFICVHGNKIIPEKYLVKGRFINIHPCLSKYPGHNPVRRYIENRDIIASVESQYLIKEVDEGSVICGEHFGMGEVSSYAEFYNNALPFYFTTMAKTLEELNIKP